MTLSDLQHLLERCASARIAVVGDLMLDCYVYGSVDRISPEAPIPVMTHARETAMLGGAGNVARNLAALGVKTILTGVVGADQAGRTLAGLIEAESELEADLITVSDRPTTVKTRFIAAGQQLMRLDSESGAALGEAETKLIAATRSAASTVNAVLLSDYAKGALTQGVITAAVEGAAEIGAAVAVDPKGRSFKKYGAVDVIKPNAKELALVTGLPTGDDAEVERALEIAIEDCAAKAILVTRAGAGMSLLVRGRSVRHFRSPARQVFDVSGAGDTVLAALGTALASGSPLEEAVEFALLASGVVVGKVGTATVTPGELLDAEMAQHVTAHDRKIVTLDGVLTWAARWRAQGFKVGFTNGCFDILHRGHVTYLASARASCDRLIVAVNTDASVRALKGEGRPVNELEARALVLAGLASVDLVTPFDAQTPIALIEAIRPDVLLKGADYTLETVVGAHEVLAYGGEVRLVPLVEGYSTTAAIKTMAQRG